METLIIDIPEQKSALVKELLKELGVGIRETETNDESVETNTDVNVADHILKAVEEARSKYPPQLKTKKNSVDKILEDFGANPDFPSIEEIRAKAWPKKW